MNKINTIADMTFIPIYVHYARESKERFYSSLVYEHDLEKYRDCKILNGNYTFKFSTWDNRQWPGATINKKIIITSNNFTVRNILYELCKRLSVILSKCYSYDMYIVKFNRINDFEYEVRLDY